MAKEINLLLGKKKESPVIVFLRTYLTPISFIVLLIFLLISGVTFIYKFNLASKKTKKESKINLFTQVIASQNQREEKYYLLSQRLAALEKILPNLLDVYAISNEIKSLISAEIIVQSFSIDEKKGVKLQLTASDSSAVDELVDKLLESQKFINVKVVSVSRGEEPSYELSFEIKSEQEALK